VEETEVPIVTSSRLHRKSMMHPEYASKYLSSRVHAYEESLGDRGM
jgi:hypothetical protein